MWQEVNVVVACNLSCSSIIARCYSSLHDVPICVKLDHGSVWYDGVLSL